MNNSENKNEGLNAVSLGSVNDVNENLNVPISDIPPIQPVTPVEPVESLGNVDTLGELPPVEPVVENVEQNNFNGIIGGDNLNNEIPPVSPVTPMSYDIPEPINNFSTTPVFNEIGTVPPIPNVPVVDTPMESKEPKKKGKLNKTLFVLIIVLALTAVGVGVYIFLHMTNVKPLPVRTKNIELEMGSSVSTDIADYATFNGIDSSTCSLDTTSVTDTNTLNAEYTYKILCGVSSYTGKIKIVDTKKPEVKVKDVTVAVNETIMPDAFIEECKDASKCSFTFKDEKKVKEYLKTPESYKVTIIVKDEAGNEVEVTGTLIVSNTVSSVYLICTKENTDYLETNRFGLIDSAFSKVATRIYTFKFASSEEYNSFKNENSSKSEVTYKNITGKPEFNDTDLTLNITKILTYEELNSESGSTVPLPTGELKSFYTNKGYDCKIGF